MNCQFWISIFEAYKLIHTVSSSQIFEMAETMNDLDDTEMDRLNYFWEHKTSYILDSFDLNNPDLRENLAIIVITIGFFMLLCYITLLMKLKKWACSCMATEDKKAKQSSDLIWNHRDLLLETLVICHRQ